MKRALVVLSAASSLLSGCIAYSPSPSTSDLGYTYDFSLPIAGAARPAIPSYFSEIPERGPSYVSEQVPPPPRVPPVYSSIPDATPGPAAPAGQTTRTVIVPSSPTIREASGAATAETLQQPQAVPVSAANPVVLYGGGGSPIFLNDTNQFGTNGTNIDLNGGINSTNTNNVVTTNLTSTNAFGVITNGVTNNVASTNLTSTNTFGVLPGTNINEAAGAANTNAFGTTPRFGPFTNSPPAAPPLNEPAGAPQPRLPMQPRIPSTSTNQTTFPGAGGTASQGAVQQQIQSQGTNTTQGSTTTTAPAQNIQQSSAPFAPVAPK